MRSIRRSMLVSLALSAAAGAQASFLDPIDFPSPNTSIGTLGFGASITIADVDGDGCDDLVAAEPGATVDGVLQAGLVWIFHGPDLTRVASVAAAAPTTTEQLGAGGVDVGDVDADGHLDLLASGHRFSAPTAAQQGRLHLFLGPDFSEEFTFLDPTPTEGGRLGEALLLADLDGDGRADVVGGAMRAPGENAGLNVGEVHVWYADALGSPRTIRSPTHAAGGLFGASLGALRRSDTRTSLVVGAPGVVLPGVSAGILHAFDGATLAREDDVLPPESYVGPFGTSFTSAEFNGDGHADLVVGSPYGSVPDGDGADGMLALVFGPTFEGGAQIIASPAGPDAAAFGERLTAADIDGDGWTDIVASDPGGISSPWFVRVFHGPEFVTYQTLADDEPALSAGFGSAVAVGDLDDDGLLDVVVQAGGMSAPGRLFVFLQARAGAPRADG